MSDTLDGHVTHLSALAQRSFDRLVRALAPTSHPHGGRPWALALAARVHVACAHIRTNLTVRELAVVFAISKSQDDRILVDIVPRLAALLATPPKAGRRTTWIVDGTLAPTRDPYGGSEVEELPLVVQSAGTRSTQ